MNSPLEKETCSLNYNLLCYFVMILRVKWCLRVRNLRVFCLIFKFTYIYHNSLNFFLSYLPASASSSSFSPRAKTSAWSATSDKPVVLNSHEGQRRVNRQAAHWSCPGQQPFSDVHSVQIQRKELYLLRSPGNSTQCSVLVCVAAEAGRQWMCAHA